jgi:DNA ligase-associated metallophosphoesterase
LVLGLFWNEKIFNFASFLMTMAEQSLEINLHGEDLILLPEKVVFWPRFSTLFFADLHLGKVSHFRKAGIAIPVSAKRATLDRVEDLLLRYVPQSVIILGDLFHSDYNQGWLAFNDLLERYPEIEFVLVEGNHDILSSDLYQNSRITLISGYLERKPFILSHEPLDTVREGLYNLCGHIHPCVRMVGKAHQTLRLPCFYFGDHTGILPAFGTFTGNAIIQPLSGEKVYVIADNKVIKVA